MVDLFSIEMILILIGLILGIVFIIAGFAIYIAYHDVYYAWVGAIATIVFMISFLAMNIFTRYYN